MTAQQARFLAEEVMGWKVVRESTFLPEYFIKHDKTAVLPCSLWSPATSETDCAELLRAVAEDKRGGILEHLEQQWLKTEEMGPKWFLLTATPAQVTAAVLAAYGYREEE